MKKMIVCAVALTVAAVSQAITVQWGTEGRGYFGTTSLNAGTHQASAYLLALESSAVSGSLIDDLYAQWKGGEDPVSVAGPALSTSLGAAGSTAGIADGASIPNTELKLTEDTTYFASVFFVTVGGQDYVYVGTSYLYDKTSSRWNGTSEILDVRAALPSGTTWDVIPEPTAMALLALGAAAAGLRRRFRG